MQCSGVEAASTRSRQQIDWDSPNQQQLCMASCVDRESQGSRGKAGHSHLPSTADLRLQTDTGPSPDIDRADSLGTIELVAADRHEVDVEVIHIDGDFADSLCCVGVEEDLL